MTLNLSVLSSCFKALPVMSLADDGLCASGMGGTVKIGENQPSHFLYCMYIAVFHLEKWTRGGGKIKLIENWGAMGLCTIAYPVGGLGACPAPRKILNFRTCEIASGAYFGPFVVFK